MQNPSSAPGAIDAPWTRLQRLRRRGAERVPRLPRPPRWGGLSWGWRVPGVPLRSTLGYRRTPRCGVGHGLGVSLSWT
jgi:hypothetical protein